MQVVVDWVAQKQKMHRRELKFKWQRVGAEQAAGRGADCKLKSAKKVGECAEIKPADNCLAWLASIERRASSVDPLWRFVSQKSRRTRRTLACVTQTQTEPLSKQNPSLTPSTNHRHHHHHQPQRFRTPAWQTCRNDPLIIRASLTGI